MSDQFPVFARVQQTALMGQVSAAGMAGPVERVPLLLARGDVAAAQVGRAEWDGDPAGWYMTKDSNVEALKPWTPTFIALRWTLLETESTCWRCRRPTKVMSICLSADYMTCVPDDPFQQEIVGDMPARLRLRPWQIWLAVPAFACLAYVKHVNGSAKKALESACPLYRPDVSKQFGGERYWMNHCEHCGMKLGDFFLHVAPEHGQPFFPKTEAAGDLVKIRSINTPLIVQASGIYQDPAESTLGGSRRVGVTGTPR